MRLKNDLFSFLLGFKQITVENRILRRFLPGATRSRLVLEPPIFFFFFSFFHGQSEQKEI
jgi:hypothetical protein